MSLYRPNPTRLWNRFDNNILDNSYQNAAEEQMAFKSRVLKHGQHTKQLTNKQQYARDVLQNTSICRNTATICHPTSSSDVPGNIMMLCTNPMDTVNGDQFIQQPRRNMGINSNNFPSGYSNLKSAIFFPAPILYYTSPILSWVFPPCNIPVLSVNIYKDNVFLLNVTNNVNSIETTEYGTGTYTITSLNGNVSSIDGDGISVP
jgi:hypothetical protein